MPAIPHMSARRPPKDHDGSGERTSRCPERTRIALHTRMSFAAFMPRKHWLNGHLVLARRIDSARFSRIDQYSPRNLVHAFKLSTPDDVDAEFAGWLGEAYLVGAQEHLIR